MSAMIFNTEHLQDMRALLQRVEGRQVHRLEVSLRPLAGGLEAAAVSRVSARYCCEAGRRYSAAFVLKQLDGVATREAHVYSVLQTSDAGSFAPRLLGVHEWSGRSILCLEAVNRVNSWPWREQVYTRRVMELLAHLHTFAAANDEVTLPSWDYETYLQEMADTTLEQLKRLRGDPTFAVLTRRLPSLRRIVHALPALRRQLLAWPGFGNTLIHGDVHPGNVLIHRRKGREEPKLIDWARARIGSPLEDVNSWLQSLGYWEPEARRRHDTLLAHYLEIRGITGGITPAVRSGYWLAGASNALSGALLYHLQLASQKGEQQPAAIRAARDWLRIVRQADACWTSCESLN